MAEATVGEILGAFQLGILSKDEVRKELGYEPSTEENN